MNRNPAFQARPRQFNVFVESGTSTDVVDVREQRKEDEKFISNFTRKILGRKSDVGWNKVKISEARGFLRSLIKRTREVKDEIVDLNKADREFDSKFGMLEKELDMLNDKIAEFESGMKDPLLKALKRRVKRRKAMKEKKAKLKAWKEGKEEEIKRQHEMIDKLLLERSEEVESTKREAAFKCQADSVLLEVRRKKNEAKKMLNLLPALAKLRELRSEEEEKIGGYVSKMLSEAFEQVIGRFRNLWEKQLEVYKLEEKGLKIMLEESALPCRKPPELETNLLQWEKALFGDVTNDEKEKALTTADVDVQALVEARRDWDQFLAAERTPMASNIPLGWVLPPETEDEDWKAFAPCRKPSLE